MKKSNFFIGLLVALVTAAFLFSCDSGSGGGGGGGNNSSSQKTTVKITIPEAPSSDIAADITASDTADFLYEISFSGDGGEYGPKSAIPGKSIEFDNVVYGTYAFTLNIYAYTNKGADKKIKLYTKTITQAVSESANSVTFNDLKYSDYKKIFLVSTFERLVAIFNGKYADGITDIDEDVKNSGDSVIYLTDDITIPAFPEGSGFTRWDVESPVKTTLDMQGHTIKLEDNLPFRFKNTGLDVTFKNGTMEIYSISVCDTGDDSTTGTGSSSSSGEKTKLTFDGVQISRIAQDPDSPTPEVSPAILSVTNGTMVLTGGTSVTGDLTISSNVVDVSNGGLFVMLGASVKCESNDYKAIVFGGQENGAYCALVDSYAGLSATGANTVTGGMQVKQDCYPSYVVVFGGNSYADEISANGQSLSLAQSSACTSSSGKFMGGLGDVNSASGTLCNICIYGDTVSGGETGGTSYTMFTMPTGFPSIGTPVSGAFAAPEGCFWDEKTGSAIYYKLKQES